MSFIYSLCAKLTSWGYIFIVQSWVVLIISNSWQEHKSVYVPKNVKLLLNRSCLHTFATGLFRVVECRSEDGHTYCFLCHCCRTRSNRQDIIDHLTKSSHLLNYLMEIHPEDVEVMMADMNDDYPLLHSLAKKVEEEEGRGELQVLNPPESLCGLLTYKSYHWCKYRRMPIHCFLVRPLDISSLVPTLCSWWVIREVSPTLTWLSAPNTLTDSFL